MIYKIDYAHNNIYYDSLRIEKSGLIVLEGWTDTKKIEDKLFPQCFLNGFEISLFQNFRTFRPDVAKHLGSNEMFLGVTIIYKILEEIKEENHQVKIIIDSEIIFETVTNVQTVIPAYDNLFETPKVLHREHIYGSGPSVKEISAEDVKSLGNILSSPVLDFGCGAGALIQYLRKQGTEAYGLEIDNSGLIESILPEIKPFIKIYDGNCPLPFKDNEFQSVIATEVIEHIPNYEQILSELARITSETLVVTVPDISSIPICYPNNVIPWHLLEATHVNFFNQSSLRNLLEKYFTKVQIGKIGPVSTNGSKWYTSLFGICRK